MTIHLGKPDYKCSKCGEIFFPYKIDIECPNCGITIPSSEAKNYFDSIKEIAKSMKIHKCLYGRFVPWSWSYANTGDHIQDLLFQLFDLLEAKKPKNEEKFITETLENDFDWGDKEYLKKHIGNIAVDLLPIYNGMIKNISAKEKLKINDSYGIPF
ncbi:MAG: hypothetical protein WCG99_01255 [Candidatus Berkelbacteria bacterium]